MNRISLLNFFFSVQRKVRQLLGGRNSRESTAVKVSLHLKEALWINEQMVFTFLWHLCSHQVHLREFQCWWYFISFSDDNFFCFRAILCKGSKYPPILPKPTIQILPFEIPVCELKSDKGLLEVKDVLLNLFLQKQSWFAFSCISGLLFLSDEIDGTFLILLLFLLVKCLYRFNCLSYNSQKFFYVILLAVFLDSSCSLVSLKLDFNPFLLFCDKI